MVALPRWLSRPFTLGGASRAVYEERLRAQQQMLQQTTDYLTELKQELEDKNLDITASVQYASYIQQATVPTEDDLRRYVPDGFIYYQPRDIVSGDLPWVHPYNEGVLIAALDCTGHGVPGALIAMLAYALLNETISVHPHLPPSRLLTELDRLMTASLSQSNPEARKVRDGMDIALVHYRPALRELTFAGAHRPLFLLRKGSIHEYSGSTDSIGPSHQPTKQFEDTVLRVEPEDRIYLFSDGITDQFGAETGKKLLKTRFREFLLEVEALPMAEQRERIRAGFESWKGHTPQTDDVLVMGLKF